MADDKRYNGWANYETWAVALWIDNDQGLYFQRQEMAEEIVKDHPVERSGSRKSVMSDRHSALADALKSWVDEMAPDLGASLFSDLLGAALSEVDWYELAEHWIDDAVEAVA